MFLKFIIPFSRVREGSFDVFGVLTAHGDVATFCSFELFRFAEIVVILFGRATDHFAVLGDLDFFHDGFSSFLLHNIFLFGSDDDVETVGESFDVFFDAEGCFDGIHKLPNRVSRAVH